MLLRLLAILITTTATTTRYILNALYHIISSSSNARLVIKYVCVLSMHADIHPVVSGAYSFVSMMDENWLANVVTLALVVVLLDSFAVGY